MRINLRALFIVLTAAAVCFAWLANRQIPRFMPSLVQYVPSGGSRPFEAQFYENLLARLKRSHSAVYDEMQDPENEIRDLLRLEVVEKSDNSQLITVNAFGNPITGDDAKLKKIYSCALESLNEMGNSGPGQRKLKMLNQAILP